jgi:outer membrane biosynthesis protein TonB
MTDRLVHERTQPGGKLLVLGMLILAALSPAPALAQDAAETRAYLLSVSQLYDALEYESALAQIARARAVTHTPAGNVTLSLYEGLILADMNRKEEAVAAFRAALLVQPDAKLPVKVSPKVAQQFEQVRDTVKQQLAAQQKPPTPPPPAPVLPKPKPKPAEVVVQPPPVPEKQNPPAPAASVSTVSRKAEPANRSSFTRPQFLVPAVGGAVLMTLGATSWAMSRKQLSSLKNDTPVDGQEAHHIASQGKTFQTLGVGMLGAGVAGLGFAIGWYALGSPHEETALRVGTDGTSAFVQGRWP